MSRAGVVAPWSRLCVDVAALTLCGMHGVRVQACRLHGVLRDLHERLPAHALN
jgi:hypothetical protein